MGSPLMQPSCRQQLPTCAPSLVTLGVSSNMAQLSSQPSLALGNFSSLSSGLPSLTTSLSSGLPSLTTSLSSGLPSLTTILSGLPSLTTSLSSGLPSLTTSLDALPNSLPGSLTGFSAQQGEKQLFEKFWRGTFKAVATPRPESVIVASITARRRVTSTEPSACQAVGADDERKVKVSDSKVVLVSDRQPCIPHKRRKHGSRRRTRNCSGSLDDHSPLPASKGKKKRRKSERKRRRKRSPSYSLSPQRKKKKKKKKSSKKSRRHRYSSRKTKHSSSSLKRKRKDERKHKKSSCGHSHRRRKYRRSESESSAWRSSSEDSRHLYRHHLHKSVKPGTLEHLAAQRQDTTTSLDQRGLEWGPAAKSVCKTAPNYRSILVNGTIVASKPGEGILNTKRVHHHALPTSREGPQDYDSGNDTSSPPSTKNGVSRTNGISNKRSLCRVLASPEKLRCAGDNVSDSGNSVTSYASLCKPLPADGGLSNTILSGNCKSEQLTSRCSVEVVRPQQSAMSLLRAVTSSRRRRKRAYSSSSRSRSRSRSSGRSRRSRRYSGSRSPSSSRRLYSRSPSYSGSLRRKGSVGSTSSRGSYARLSPDRLREGRGSPTSTGQVVKMSRKYNGKRRAGRSYSPMTKRRRDSPSHLEARRITSARKRPIPYFRPSPSSSSRSTSVSSWSSLFTRSRSRSPVHSLGRSRSRSRTYSSYRSYSRSSSWNSIFGGRSRSQSRSQSRCYSYVSLEKHSKTRH